MSTTTLEPTVAEPISETIEKTEIEFGEAPPCVVTNRIYGKCKNKADRVVHLYCTYHSRKVTIWICNVCYDIVKKEGANHMGGFFSPHPDCVAKLVNDS